VGRQGLWLGNFTVAQRADDLQDLGPGREWPGVGPLVLIDGHDELELLVGHLALLGRPAIVAASSAGAATTIQTHTPVHYALTPVPAASSILEFRIIRVSAKVVLSSVG